MDTDSYDLDTAKELINKIYFSEILAERKNKNGSIQKLYKKVNDTEAKQALKSILEKMYVDGIGFKLIVKKINLPNFTYTVCRKVLKDLDIQLRVGTHVITDHLKKVRSENAKIDNNFTDWPIKRPELLKNNKRFIGGYYFNRSKQKYVFLRSSWEYVYAEWLDNNNFEWDVEVRQYEVLDGLKYLPDFFIYEKGILKKIVEIKSSFYYTSKDRMKKYYAFKEIYEKDLEIELICDLQKILKFTELKTKSAIAKKWKKTRKNYQEI
jgi:hypothetical protein